MKKHEKSKRLNNIEFLRFVFSVIIVYFHLLFANMITATNGGTDFLNHLADLAKNAGMIVECFFILGGYFLYQSYKRHPQISVKEFAYGKFARLWPVLFFYFFILAVVYKQSPYICFFNSLFLQNIGISLDPAGITWYISPFFWVLILYFVLYKHIENKKHLNIGIGVTVYLSYMLLINYSNGSFTRGQVFSVFNGGVLRALGGIGLGCLIAVCFESIKNMPSVKNFKPSKIQSFFICLIVSVLEIVALGGLYIHFLRGDIAYNNTFIVVILFTLLLVCMLSQKGIVSRIFSFKPFGVFGKYSYSIYVMQQIAFWILRDVFWKKNIPYIQQHGLRAVIISVAFAVALGILTYYVVEKPSAVLLNKLGKKLFAEKEPMSEAA